MPKTTLFIGSSSSAKAQAKALAKEFSGPTVEFLPWWKAFKPGSTLLAELDKIYKKVDGALLVFSPESTTKLRNKKRNIINLNVLFEFGYFYGAFGAKGVAVIKYGDLYLPSDLGGYIHISGSKSFKRNRAAKIGKKTRNDFTRWIQAL